MPTPSEARGACCPPRKAKERRWFSIRTSILKKRPLSEFGQRRNNGLQGNQRCSARRRSSRDNDHIFRKMPFWGQFPRTLPCLPVGVLIPGMEQSVRAIGFMADQRQNFPLEALVRLLQRKFQASEVEDGLLRWFNQHERRIKKVRTRGDPAMLGNLDSRLPRQHNPSLDSRETPCAPAICWRVLSGVAPGCGNQ